MSKFWDWVQRWGSLASILSAVVTVGGLHVLVRKWVAQYPLRALGIPFAGVIVGLIVYLLLQNRSLRSRLQDAEKWEPTDDEKRGVVKELERKMGELKDLLAQARRDGPDAWTDRILAGQKRLEAKLVDSEWFDDPRRTYLEMREWWLATSEEDGGWLPSEMYCLYGQGPGCLAHGENFESGADRRPVDWLAELFAKHETLDELLKEDEGWIDQVLDAISDGVGRLKGRYS